MGIRILQLIILISVFCSFGISNANTNELLINIFTDKEEINVDNSFKVGFAIVNKSDRTIYIHKELLLVEFLDEQNNSLLRFPNGRLINDIQPDYFIRYQYLPLFKGTLCIDSNQIFKESIEFTLKKEVLLFSDETIEFYTLVGTESSYILRNSKCFSIRLTYRPEQNEKGWSSNKKIVIKE